MAVLVKELLLLPLLKPVHLPINTAIDPSRRYRVSEADYHQAA